MRFLAATAGHWIGLLVLYEGFSLAFAILAFMGHSPKVIQGFIILLHLAFSAGLCCSVFFTSK